MRKLKYTLLFVMLIFGLNSCLTTMVGWGICEQYGCTPSPKKNGIEGVEIFAEENFIEFKNYFESLKKRETVMVKAILKKIKDGYYLYDEEKKIGFFVIEDLRASQSYDKRDIEKIFNGTDRKDYKIINVNKGVQTLKDKEGLILKLKKLSKNYYALASFYESDEHSKEIQEIYDYLLEKM